MSEFDITFELFTLLLGLTMAEVLAGYARAYKLRSRIRHDRLAPSDTDANGKPQQIRIGWLVPLSAAVVLFHQATFWLFMYEVQGNVPLHLLSLVCVLAVIGWYYLISAALWPDEPEAWPDFDEYYMAHRRFIWLGVIAIAVLVEIGYTVYSEERAIDAPAWIVELVDWADMIGTLTLLAMPFVKSRRWAVGLLAIIVAHFAITTIFAPWTFV
ncbi:hypothetical protein AAG612_13850 [Citromicrobium bathyomarinum]|uniref:hypothetical protein n=1 Tax=Citromicrobium bathyomarinum TaxID=72174 RepID=UPI00315B2AED